MEAVRNIAIIVALAAAVAFVPGGGDTASLIGAILSTLIIASLVLLAARFFRERRLDIDGLGDRWRLVLYGAIGVVIVTLAASDRLLDTGAGTLLWIALIAGASYALYLTWRQYREYG